MKKTLLATIGSLLTCVCIAQANYDSLDINNVNPRLNAGGELFFDPIDMASKFEVPKGSGIMSIFAANIWIGGLNFSGPDTLYLAAMQYGAAGRDYWAGPVMDSIHYMAQAAQWDRVWKINRSTINDHINNWNQQNYVVPQEIADWPAHGDIQYGQALYLAPFHDHNYNSIYDPSNGDYPLIKGDQAVYFIINDDKEAHTETGGQKMKIELHCMAYAMDCVNDSALYNTIFLNYRIINRSSKQYEQTRFGTWVDFDLGCYNDDYVGCDVERGTFFVYNSVDPDLPCQGAPGYGPNPPAQGVTILKGPAADANGQDDIDNCGFSFGVNDQIIDNEHLGLDVFNITIPSPNFSLDYYNLMRGLYLGNPMFTPDNVQTTMLFPDSSDPNFCATSGIPYLPWSEITVGNTPLDRRGLGSTGPFTFVPGQVEELDLAFVFGKAWAGGVDSSVQVMKSYVDDIRMMFFSDSTPCGLGLFSGIQPLRTVAKKERVTLYPNPTHDAVYISGNFALPATLRLYDIAGHRVKEVLLSDNKQLINLSRLSGGLYLYTVLTEEGTTATGKLVIR